MASSLSERTRALGRIEQVATIAALGLLIVGCFVVLRPFISALLWAGIVCYCTWPLYVWLERVLRGRRSLAAAVMMVLSALVLVLPFAVVGLTLASNLSHIIAAITDTVRTGLPPPPGWFWDMPFVGGVAADRWQDLASHPERTAAFVKDLLAGSQTWFLRRGLDLGQGVLQLSLSVLISFFFYRDGEAVIVTISDSAKRLAGDQTQHLVSVVGRTIRGVVYGVLGTALGQGMMAGIGFWIAGVPSPLLLGLLVFFLSVVPVGPPVIWVPATVWLYFNAGTGWAAFMVLWGTLGISGVDNLLRPYLISRETKQSFALTLLGVMGGVLAFGFIGFFLGPTLLAVGYSLLRDWSARSREGHPTAEAGDLPATKGPEGLTGTTGPAASPAPAAAVPAPDGTGGPGMPGSPPTTRPA